MATLRETRDRIASVRSTLKITSAMKLVASSKLRKAQRAIEAFRPYERAMEEIFVGLSKAFVGAGGDSIVAHSLGFSCSEFNNLQKTSSLSRESVNPQRKTAIIAISSNSSMCGAFNHNVIKEALRVGQMAGVGLSAVCEFLPLGRKIREALTRAGCNFFSLEEDWSESKRLDSLVAKPSYEASSALGLEILEKYLSGEYERIVLVYNSFISAGKQLPVVETLLPLSEEAGAWQSGGAGSAGSVGPIVKKGEEYMSQGGNSGKLVVGREYIFEPSAMQIAKELLPKLVCLKLHAAILDSQAAEHAARTLAMQLSSDNAQKLLSELTLEYNKARQQQITAEILDLAAGAL